MGTRSRGGGSVGLVLALACMLSIAVPTLLGQQDAVAQGSDTWAIDNLNVGDTVADKSWDWEFRTDDSYEFRFADDREPKPVTWVVVAKNHYGDSVSGDHITLVAEELIGRYHFDGDNDNHWEHSDLRTWLNGLFYDAMSPAFQNMLLETAVPNQEWEAGVAYSTADKVFIPSVTELGADADTSYEIGESWGIFSDDDSRKAALVGSYTVYWTRSPHTLSGQQLHTVHWGGNISFSPAHRVTHGVRPVINVPSTVRVSRTPHEGIYSIESAGVPAKPDKPDRDENGKEDPAGSVITVRPGESIQAAIDAAQAGDTVYVKAGTYVERLTFNSGITLRGEGRDVTTITYRGEAPVVTVHDASSGTITGFTVRYAGEGNNSAIWVSDSRLSILNCTVDGAGLSGIAVSDPGSDVLLSHNVIRDNSQSGIFFYGGAQGTVHDNEIYGNGYQGISVRDTSTDLLIENNVIRDNTQNGIFFYGGAQGTVHRNEIRGSGLSGIGVRDAGTDPVIERNVLRDNTQSGIFIYGGAQGTVHDNEIYGNGYHGISARNAGTAPLIEGNVIRDNTQSGIFIRAGAQGTVRNNEIYGNGYRGIGVVNAGTAVEITHNTIALNDSHGVWVYDEAQATLTNNIIALNGSRGVAGNRADHPDGQVALSHNNVWGNEAGDYRGLSAHRTDISADPQFVDVEARDFRLRPTSPVVGAAEEEAITETRDPLESGTLTDIDGNVYTTVIIGTQEWTVENIRTTTYADGSPIPTGLSEEEWSNTTEGAYTVYPYAKADVVSVPMPREEVRKIASREEMVASFGKLYNWYALTDERGLAPEGWRVPTDEDWKKLEAYADSQYGPGDPEWDGTRFRGHDAGKRLKHNEKWPLIGGGTNVYGFSATPGGLFTFGSFVHLGQQGHWWTSSDEGITFDGDAWSRNLYVYDDIARDEGPKTQGLSVRLVRDVR